MRSIAPRYIFASAMLTLAACGEETLPAGARADVLPDVPTSAFVLTSERGCLLDRDCNTGLFCFQNQCTRECATDDPCEDGSTCSPRGRCGATAPLPSAIVGSAIDLDLDEELRATAPTRIAVELDTLPDSPVEVDPGEPFVSVTLRTAAPVPGGVILYRVELEGREAEASVTLRAEGSQDFRFQIPTGSASGEADAAALQRAYLITSVGGFQIEIIPRISVDGFYAGEIDVREFGGAAIPIRFGLRVLPEGATFEEADLRYLLLPSGAEDLMAPLRARGGGTAWVERPIEFDAVAGVYFARFAHRFSLGEDSLFRRPDDVVRSLRIEIGQIEDRRLIGAAADRWQGLFDARTADGVIAPGQVTIAGRMVASRVGPLPAEAKEPLAGTAETDAPPTGQPLPITACGGGVFDALRAEVLPEEPATFDPCAAVGTLDAFVVGASEARATCAIALADVALQGVSTAAQVRAFLDDAQPNPGGLSFGEFLERCASGQGYCVPSPEALCSEQLLAFAYQAQSDELALAGTLLDRYQTVAREAYLGRQLAAFQVDTKTRLEWLRKSEAPLFLASQLQAYNEEILDKWEQQVLQAHFEVLARQFAPTTLEVLARAPTDPVAISARRQMLLEQVQTWQGAMEALQIAAERWNGLYQNDTDRARATSSIRTRIVDLYLSAAVLAHIDRGSGGGASGAVLGTGFSALLRSQDELSLPFNELIFMRDAEVVVSRSVDPTSSSSTLLSEREEVARRAVRDAQESVDRVLADIEASEVNAQVLTDRMQTQLDELRAELVSLCGLPSGCTPADMSDRPECSVQVEVGACGFMTNGAGAVPDTFEALEEAENVSEGGAALLSYRQALLEHRIAEEAYRANEERARIEHENAEAFARKVVEWGQMRERVGAEVGQISRELLDIQGGAMRDEMAVIDRMQSTRAQAYERQRAEVVAWDKLRFGGIEADMKDMTAINALQTTAAALTFTADELDKVGEAIADGMPTAVGLANDVSAPSRLAIALSTLKASSGLRVAAAAGEAAASNMQRLMTEAQARRDATLANLTDLAALGASQSEVELATLAADLRAFELESEAAIRSREALIDSLRRNLEIDLAYERDLVELRDRRDLVRRRLVDSPALALAILRAEVGATQRVMEYLQVAQRSQLLEGRYLAMADRLDQLDVLIASPAVIFAYANRLARAESRVERAKGLLYDWLVALEYYAVRPFVSQRLAVLLARNPSQLEAIANDLLRLQRVCGGLVNYEVVDLSLRDDLLQLGFAVRGEEDGEDVDAATRFRAVLARGNVPIDTQVRYSTDERIGDLIGSREVLAASFDLRLGDFANLPLTCNAKLASIDIRLVGEELGSHVRPTVSLLYDGTSALRSCQPNIDAIVGGLAPGTTSFGAVTRFRTAGRSISPIADIGTFGADDSANRGLEGLPLASSYTILIDPAAGENHRVNWTALDDIELRLTYAYQDLFSAGQCE